MKKLTCCLSVVALFLSSAEAQNKKVEVSEAYEYVKEPDGEVKIKSLPYLKRRPPWSVRLGVGFNSLKLKDVNNTGVKRKGAPFQVDLSITKNYGLFSIGPELGYSAAKFDNQAEFTAFSLGLVAYLSGLTQNAYVVPFVGVGGMSISSKNGTLACAAEPGKEPPTECSLTDGIIPYYRAGLLIGLNWIDKGTALGALSEYGLQNSFLYVAAKKISSTTSVEGNFDLETEFYLEYGLQLEF